MENAEEDAFAATAAEQCIAAISEGWGETEDKACAAKIAPSTDHTCKRDCDMSRKYPVQSFDEWAGKLADDVRSKTVTVAEATPHLTDTVSYRETNGGQMVAYCKGVIELDERLANLPWKDAGPRPHKYEGAGLPEAKFRDADPGDFSSIELRAVANAIREDNCTFTIAGKSGTGRITDACKNMFTKDLFKVPPGAFVATGSFRFYEEELKRTKDWKAWLYGEPDIAEPWPEKAGCPKKTSYGKRWATFNPDIATRDMRDQMMSRAVKAMARTQEKAIHDALTGAGWTAPRDKALGEALESLIAMMKDGISYDNMNQAQDGKFKEAEAHLAAWKKKYRGEKQ